VTLKDARVYAMLESFIGHVIGRFLS